MRHIFVKRLLISLAIFGLFMSCLVWRSMRLHGITPLGNGYCYWYSDAGVMIDCAPQTRVNERIQRVFDRAEREGVEVHGLPVAGPDLDGYRVYPGMITGHVSPARRRDSFGDPIRLADNQKGPTGYFVIDTGDDVIRNGLRKKEWLKVLRGFGVTSEPELYRPSIYDKILRRNRPSQ